MIFLVNGKSITRRGFVITFVYSHERSLRSCKGLITMIIEFPLETSDVVNELSESFFESLKME
jgi:hypothetical protein